MKETIIKIPLSLKTLFNQESFTAKELFELISNDEDAKKFLSDLKPVIIEYLKTEFPAIGLLGIF